MSKNKWKGYIVAKEAYSLAKALGSKPAVVLDYFYCDGERPGVKQKKQ